MYLPLTRHAFPGCGIFNGHHHNAATSKYTPDLDGPTLFGEPDWVFAFKKKKNGPDGAQVQVPCPVPSLPIPTSSVAARMRCPKHRPAFPHLRGASACNTRRSLIALRAARACKPSPRASPPPLARAPSPARYQWYMSLVTWRLRAGMTAARHSGIAQMIETRMGGTNVALAGKHRQSHSITSRSTPSARLPHTRPCAARCLPAAPPTAALAHLAAFRPFRAAGRRDRRKEGSNQCDGMCMCLAGGDTCPHPYPAPTHAAAAKSKQLPALPAAGRAGRQQSIYQAGTHRHQ